MDAIETIMKTPHKLETFLVVLAAILAVQFVLKLFDWFVDRFGLETKKTLEQKNINGEIEKIKGEVIELRECQKSMELTQRQIAEAIQRLDEREITNDIEHKRWEVLDFANAIRKRDYDREAYNHVLKTYDSYEQILKQKDMENGQADIAIAYIRQRYQDYLKTGFPEY